MTRALIADDDLAMLDLVQTILMTAGHDVVAVTNGSDAVVQLRTVSFDFVVLDVQMPGLSGLDVLAETGDLEPERPPVMILSGLTTFHDRTRGLDAGARMYLAKPFRVDDFCRAIEDLIAGRTESRSARQGTLGQPWR